MVFIPNPRFIDELTAQPDYMAAMKSAAGSAAPKAEGFAQHTMPRKGHRRIEVVEQEGEVLLVNTNFGAHLEEFGSVNNSPVAPLRRGVRAAGFALKESSL